MSHRSSLRGLQYAQGRGASWLWPVLAGVVACSMGCTRVKFSDSVDLTLDFAPLTGPSDLLHTPYVEGSSMRIFVDSTNDNERYEGWSLSSSDPTIFSVENLQGQSGFAAAKARALRPGHATLTVTDSGGHVVATDGVDVERPDEVRLLSHGLLLVDRGEDEARVSDLRVVEGGTGTYLARYYRAGHQVFGNGTLTATADTGSTAKVEQSYLFEDRDWLQVSPGDGNAHQIALSVNGTPFGQVTLSGVARTDLAGVRILGEDEGGAKKDQLMVAFALANDSAGRAVYGVEYSWQLGGKTSAGMGDLFRYRYDAQRPQMLTASAMNATGQMSAQAMIHASSGFVDSTNRVGCATVPPGAPGGPWRGVTPAWLLLVVGWGAMGMRRRLRRSHEFVGRTVGQV